MIRAMVLLALACALAGCGANARYARGCEWPPDHEQGALDLQTRGDRRHLSDDAHAAEDIAIRHADVTAGPQSGRHDRPRYREARESCKAALFAAVSRQHGVPVADVEQSIGDRRAWLDALVILPFAVIYLFIAGRIAARLLGGALADAPVLAAVLLMAAALVTSAAGVLAGDVWSGLAESVRIGNGHVSYRVERVPWRQRPVQLFAAGVVVFVVAAARQWPRDQRSA